MTIYNRTLFFEKIKDFQIGKSLYLIEQSTEPIIIEYIITGVEIEENNTSNLSLSVGRNSTISQSLSVNDFKFYYNTETKNFYKYSKQPEQIQMFIDIAEAEKEFKRFVTAFSEKLDKEIDGLQRLRKKILLKI
jgi:hypothetical protein